MFGAGGWSGDALALFAFGAVTVPIAILLFHRALEEARRAGTLAQY